MCVLRNQGIKAAVAGAAPDADVACRAAVIVRPWGFKCATRGHDQPGVDTQNALSVREEARLIATAIVIDVRDGNTRSQDCSCQRCSIRADRINNKRGGGLRHPDKSTS